jgi:hypothetical protein
MTIPSMTSSSSAASRSGNAQGNSGGQVSFSFAPPQSPLGQNAPLLLALGIAALVVWKLKR